MSYAFWHNKNPWNLMYARQHGAKHGIGGFAAFEDFYSAACAVLHQLRLYQNRGLFTLQEMYGRWQEGGPCAAQVHTLAKLCGMQLTDVVNLNNPHEASVLLHGMAQLETGTDPAKIPGLSGAINLATGFSA